VIEHAVRTCLYEKPAARYGADTDDEGDGQDGESAWAVVAPRASCGVSTARENWIWIWPTFRDRVGPAGHAASRTRLRSRSNLARPYICLLIILMRLTLPSTVPELCESVSPLRTAW
jgi:hypothetical protein